MYIGIDCTLKFTCVSKSKPEFTGDKLGSRDVGVFARWSISNYAVICYSIIAIKKDRSFFGSAINFVAILWSW